MVSDGPIASTPSNLASANEDLEIKLFHLAAQGDLDGIVALSDLSVDLHSVDYNGRTALHIAANRGHVEIVEYLLNKGLSPDTEDDNGISALSLADTGRHFAILDVMQNFRQEEPEESAHPSNSNAPKRPSFAVMEAFPMPIALAMLDGKEIKQISKDPVSIFFSDIVGFTTLSSEMNVVQVSNLLHSLFSKFDRLAYIHGVQKVDVIGDAYVAATNFTEDQPNDHAARLARFALGAAQVYPRAIHFLVSCNSQPFTSPSSS
jgi:hypothetical protein